MLLACWLAWRPLLRISTVRVELAAANDEKFGNDVMGNLTQQSKLLELHCPLDAT
jgi:hypothetical protein